ncbi:MAG: anti-sigma factor [Phycisphaerales bacterium]|nr:anti-sigma factor [Phycisphaerales bacterium]
MSAIPRPDPSRERLLELLADRATGALSDAERAELDALLARQDREIDAAVAGLLGAFEDPAPRAMPAALKDRLAAEGQRLLASGHLTAPGPGEGEPAATPRAPVAYRFPSGGWLAAALFALIAAAGWWPRLAGPPTFRQELARLTEQDPATEIVEFEAMKDPAAGAGLKGRIYWSQARQQGYMRIKDLASNDPSREQYQFWFFDKSREHPVDGGVFNLADGQVDRATGEYIIPIHAKLTVREPVMFAVTVEQPGGVVVTKKERVVMIGKPPEAPEPAAPPSGTGPT